MKTVLITGAAGFIGYHLSQRFSQQGLRVIGLDNFDHPCGAETDCLKGDVRDSTTIDRLVGNVHEVYHLAAQIHVERSYEYPQLTFDVNIGGTENILKACRKHNKRLIFASSSEVYGTAQSESISEKHALNPQSPYAESKRDAEKLCMDYAQKGVNVVILRSFNTYGPFQNNNRYGAVIPIFIRRVLGGEPLEIFGDGSQTRDFMYITDAIDAYEIASEMAPSGDPVNFGTGFEISINELSDILLNLMHSNVTSVHVNPRPNEVMRLKADTTKAAGLGFNPKVGIRDGLQMYIDWIKFLHPPS